MLQIIIVSHESFSEWTKRPPPPLSDLFGVDIMDRVVPVIKQKLLPLRKRLLAQARASSFDKSSLMQLHTGEGIVAQCEAVLEHQLSITQLSIAVEDLLPPLQCLGSHNLESQAHEI